ncbi:MAG: hypothetical protein AAF607_13220 [Pseudomonadota bacterium]
MRDYRTSVALLVAVAFMGLLALLLMDMIRLSIAGTIADEDLPEFAFTAVLCLSALPMILMVTTSNMVATYASLIITGLLALLHGLHIFEHGFAGDWAGALLIIVTMFVPTLIATLMIWRHRAATA